MYIHTMINTILEFIAIILVFFFVLGTDFSKKPIKIYFSILLFITQIIIQIFSVNLFKISIMNTFSIFLVLYFIYNQTILYKICWIALCTLAEAIASSILSYICYICYNNSFNNTYIENLLGYTDSIVFIIFIICSLLLHKSREYRKYYINQIESHNYYLIMCSCITMYLLLGISQLFFYQNLSQFFKYIIAFLILIFIIILLITIVAFLKVQYQNIALKEKDKMNQKYMEMEQAYHTQLEQKNNDLRAFRHDFNSHVFILQRLAQDEQWNQIKTYLQKLSEIRMDNYYISTGNLIADAIINNFYNSLDRNILFKTSGYFNRDCFIESFDMCTILSNLTNNASEALSRKETPGTKEIYIDIDSSVNRISILMKNTSINYEENITDNMQTIKTDKKNHGFGLANIKKTAEKYHGFIKTGCNNNMFYTYVILNKPM